VQDHAISFRFLHADKVGYFICHAANGRSIFKFNSFIQPGKSHAPEDLPVFFRSADHAPYKRNFYSGSHNTCSFISFN
jgi:hypothetical protein